MEKYDVIIIGGGPAGYHAASLAAEEKMNVLLVEKQQLGGCCLNWGCIPTKTLLHTAKQYGYIQQSQNKGLRGDVAYDHTKALEWKTQVVKTLQNGVSKLLQKDKVTIVIGEAIIQHMRPNEQCVSINGTLYVSEYLLIAEGVESHIPSISGIEDASPLTSKEILDITEIPKKLAIVGAGFIGIEFASLFSQCGSHVMVFESMPEILPMVDNDCAEVLRETLKKENNIEFYLNSTVTSLTRSTIAFVYGEKEHTLDFDTLLISTGRKTNLKKFDSLGLNTSKIGIVVDEHMQTNIPNVYAIGDIVGISQLAHTAYRMAEVAIDNIMHRKTSRMRYKAIPMVVYTNPEIACCGLSETDAKKQKRAIVTASLPITTSGRVIAEHGANVKGFCKVIADKHTTQVLGIHFVGPMVSEIISTASVIIETELRVNELAEIIFPHPTVGEILHNVSRLLLKKTDCNKN